MVKISYFQRWDRWFLGLANYMSTASKDPSTKVGCVIVGPDKEVRTSGYNGFPRGVCDDDKYPIIVHAEENSIAQAARTGMKLLGCTAYTTFPPCSRCARLFIQAGIKECVWPLGDVPDRWKEDMERSKKLLTEAGISFREIDSNYEREV